MAVGCTDVTGEGGTGNRGPPAVAKPLHSGGVCSNVHRVTAEHMRGCVRERLLIVIPMTPMFCVQCALVLSMHLGSQHDVGGQQQQQQQQITR